MSQYNFYREERESSIKSSVMDLHLKDGFSLEELSELAGYKGERSLYNACKQGAHKLPSGALAGISRGVFRQGNERLVHHFIDTTTHMIMERPSFKHLGGDPRDLIVDTMVSLSMIMVRNDSEAIRESITLLRNVVARLHAEEGVKSSIMAKQLPVMRAIA